MTLQAQQQRYNLIKRLDYNITTEQYCINHLLANRVKDLVLPITVGLEKFIIQLWQQE